MTLTKALIAEAVWNKTNIAKSRSTELVDTVFEAVKQTLELGEDVLISGFGKFSVREKQERRGRNPHHLVERSLIPVFCTNISLNLMSRQLALPFLGQKWLYLLQHF